MAEGERPWSGDAQRVEDDFYQAVLEHAPWGAIVAATAIDGRCLYLNPEFTRITGYTLDDIPTVPDWIRLAYPDPDYRDLVVANWARDTSPGQMGRDVIYQVSCKDRSVRSIQFRAGMLGAARMIVMLLDVTRRMAAEQALRDSEERYRQLVEASPFGIVVHSAGIVAFANSAAARIMGVSSPAELRGREVLGFVHPDSREAVVARIRGVLEHKQNAALEEERFVRLDGSVIDVEVAGSPVQYLGTLALQVVFNDITERKRLERERRGLDRRVQQAQRIESLALLAGGVAHDLNNLLVGILGHAELARQPGRDKEVHGHLDAIVETSRRAADLAGQLLAFAGRRHLSFECVDLDRVVIETRSLLEAQVGRRAALELRLSGGLPPLRGDETQLRQVLINLVGNAADAIADRGGRIVVSTGLLEAQDPRLPAMLGPEIEPSGNYLLLEVQDDGIGMTAEDRPRIFDPFFTTKTTGRGLGLAAVLGIVRAHGGAIRVDSQPDLGTRFQTLFPILGGDEQPAVVALPVDQDTWRGAGSVLVVDDEQQIREVLAALLEELGFDVVVASGGADAVALLEQGPDRFSVVVLDLTMPGWSGERTLREIRAVNSTLPVVLSSGFDEDDTVSKLGDLVPSAYLQKPYTLASLVRALRRALG